MSHYDARIPTKDDDKNSYYIVVVPYINDVNNQLRFKTTPSVLATLNLNYGLWGPNWVKYNDKFIVNKTITDLKDSLEAKIDDSLDLIYGDIPDSILSDDDKKKFLIFDRKPPTVIVASPVSPELRMDSAGHLWAKILFHNPATPTSKEAPVGNFVFFEAYIGEAGIADADLIFTHGNVCSSSSHTFHFTNDQVGKTCYLHCYYQIKKGDRSPESVIISFMIM